MGYEDGVLAVVYSPDRKRLVQGSDGDAVNIWNTIQRPATLNGHSNWVNSVAHSSNGPRIISKFNGNNNTEKEQCSIRNTKHINKPDWLVFSQCKQKQGPSKSTIIRL